LCFQHRSYFEDVACFQHLCPKDFSLTSASILLQVSGTVIEVGPKVSRTRVGDKVCAVLLAGGAFAEEAVANQNAVFPLPPGSDEVAAAGLPVAYGAFAFQHVQKLEVSFFL
jgi:NADPH:quinone reductase-like Zn-dependent oxidoreductase